MADLWRAGALAGMAALLFAAGYCFGQGQAEARGLAALNALKVEREEERRNHSEAHGRALAEALERYEREAAQANALSAELEKSRKAHAREAEALQRRIANAVRGSTYTFSPDFVRLYNEAIGIQADALPEAVCAFGAAGSAGAGGAASARVLEWLNGVNEADLLAHISKYGRRCRGLESQVRAWQSLAKQWEAGSLDEQR